MPVKKQEEALSMYSQERRTKFLADLEYCCQSVPSPEPDSDQRMSRNDYNRKGEGEIPALPAGLPSCFSELQRPSCRSPAHCFRGTSVQPCSIGTVPPTIVPLEWRSRTPYLLFC